MGWQSDRPAPHATRCAPLTSRMGCVLLGSSSPPCSARKDWTRSRNLCAERGWCRVPVMPPPTPPHAPHPAPPTSTRAGATSVRPLSSLGCNLLLPWGDVGGPPHPKSNVGSLCPPLTTGSVAGRGSTAGSPPPCVPRRGSSLARRSCRCCEEKNPPIAPHKQWGWGTAPRVGGIGDTLT